MARRLVGWLQQQSCCSHLDRAWVLIDNIIHTTVLRIVQCHGMRCNASSIMVLAYVVYHAC